MGRRRYWRYVNRFIPLLAGCFLVIGILHLRYGISMQHMWSSLWREFLVILFPGLFPRLCEDFVNEGIVSVVVGERGSEIYLSEARPGSDEGGRDD